MAFPHTVGGFLPFFRLLDDYNDHRSGRSTKHSHPVKPSFSPRFDLRELRNSYQLDGELPGVNQRDIDIEFTDTNILSVKGHVERQYETDNSSEEEQSNQEEQKSSKLSGKSRQPTVEDEDEEGSNSTTTTGINTPSDSESSRTSELERSTSELPTKKLKTNNSTTKPKHKYWASERTIGEFRRTFTFSSPVNQDAVKASLSNGILTVVIPKAAAKPKKIAIE